MWNLQCEYMLMQHLLFIRTYKEKLPKKQHLLNNVFSDVLCIFFLFFVRIKFKK